MSTRGTEQSEQVLGVDIKGHFSSALKKSLSERGWSQRELSRRSGIHVTTINAIIQQKAVPSLSLAYSLAYFLETSLLEMLPPVPGKRGKQNGTGTSVKRKRKSA